MSGGPRFNDEYSEVPLPVAAPCISVCVAGVLAVPTLRAETGNTPVESFPPITFDSTLPSVLVQTQHPLPAAKSPLCPVFDRTRAQDTQPAVIQEPRTLIHKQTLPNAPEVPEGALALFVLSLIALGSVGEVETRSPGALFKALSDLRPW